MMPSEQSSEAKALADITQGSLSDRAVRFYTDALARHHGERVAPVSEYCQAFYDWEVAIRAKVGRLKNGTEYSDEIRSRYGAGFAAHVADEIDRWQGVLDALGMVGLALAKSSMLGRRIYGGEKLRTRMCPKHRGQWQGLDFYRECECHFTGWLPEERS